MENFFLPGAGLCQKHHTLVHEGGYTIQPVVCSEQRLNEQFRLQQHSDDANLFNFEKELRNDRESFNTVRKLSPISYRFHILDADGNDLRSSPVGSSHLNDDPYLITPTYSTRMECAEPQPCFFIT
ncbi:MAG: hypothetical protein AB8B63_23185 [Granulosicoccus sp.]